MFTGSHAASLVLFPEFNEEKNCCTSNDTNDFEKKMYSDETHAFTCGMVVIMFSCRMHRATKPMKQ